MVSATHRASRAPAALQALRGRRDRDDLYAMRKEYREALSSIDGPEGRSMVAFAVGFASGYMPDRGQESYDTMLSERPHEIVQCLGAIAYHTADRGTPEDRRLAVFAASESISAFSQGGAFWGLPSMLAEVAGNVRNPRQLAEAYGLLSRLPESVWPDALASLSRLPRSAKGRSDELDRFMLKFSYSVRREPDGTEPRGDA